MERDEPVPLNSREFDALVVRIRQAAELQVKLYAEAQHIGLDEARRRLRRLKQVGRTPCSFLDEP